MNMSAIDDAENGDSDDVAAHPSGNPLTHVYDSDGKSLTTTIRRTEPKIDLRDAHAIRREMAAVYRDMRTGRIDTQAGTRLCYVLDMVRKGCESARLQDRMEALERILQIQVVRHEK